MSLVKCSACGEQVSETAYDCPKCGHSLKKPKRSIFGKIIKWIFILFNLFMIYAIFVGLQGAGESMKDLEGAEQAGAAVGTAIGATMLFVIWFIGDVILGIFVMFTRPKK